MSSEAKDDAENPLYGDRPEWLIAAEKRANQPGTFAPAEPHTPEQLAEIRAKARENVTRLPLEEAAADTADFMSSIGAIAARELAAWAALPCLGELEHVRQCSDAFAATCERRGHVMCPREQLKRAVEAQRDERARQRSQALERGLPVLAVEAVIDREPIETPALLDLRSALSELPSPVIVVLSGGVGCGKTCAAAWWAARHGARFITATRFGRLSSYDPETDRLVMAPYLVLDDLGTEYLDKNGNFLSSLDDLINARAGGSGTRLPMVITTNLDVAEFKERYGQRIVDRVRGVGKWKRVAGQSLRRRA